MSTENHNTEVQDSEAIVLTQDEVRELSEMESQKQSLFLKLGSNAAFRKSLDDEDEATHQDIAELNRQIKHLHNRIAKKYGVTKPNARIDFNTGTIV